MPTFTCASYSCFKTLICFLWNLSLLISVFLLLICRRRCVMCIVCFVIVLLLFILLFCLFLFFCSFVVVVFAVVGVVHDEVVNVFVITYLNVMQTLAPFVSICAILFDSYITFTSKALKLVTF